jgi:hypothetical protein
MHRWPRKCPICRSHNHVLFEYYLLKNKLTMLHIRLTFIGIKTGWAPKQLNPWKIFFGSPAGPWRKNVKLCPWFRVSITCVLLYIYGHVACNIIQNIYRKHRVINCLFLNILYSNCQQCRCSCFYILGLKPILFLLNVNLFKSNLPFCIHLYYIVLKFSYFPEYGKLQFGSVPLLCLKRSRDN